LDFPEGLPPVALVPVLIEAFGDEAELDDEVAGEVLLFGPAFLAP